MYDFLNPIDDLVFRRRVKVGVDDVINTDINSTATGKN